ncbi:hypothetical protein P692DRAFT_20756458 [Suillus brevipes Sb2]|nr:hypothetical protein P692DRAFT_20756458 [Suillus brevipes Sb2]
MIFDILPLPDLASFSKTRLQNQLGITDYVANRRNNLFKKYIADIPIFIQLLEFTGSVVSGSTALNLFMPKSQEFATHDIDLYATEKYEHVVVEYLKREEGYTVAHKISSNRGYDSSAIAKIYKLENGEKHMDIIITHWTCAIAPILQFHSTVVMNYITANSIVSMYSGWTCQRKGFIHPRLYMEGKTNPRTVDALMKYTGRSFKLYAEPL